MGSMVSVRSTVVASRGQVSSDLGGEAAILNLRNETYYGLNPVGARVWNLIQTPRSVREIRDVLAAEYDVEPDRCERDVLELLGRLSEAGLIEPAGERG